MALKIASSGNYSENVIVANWASSSEETIKALNGISLGTAVKKGILLNDKDMSFEVITTTYPDGQTFEKMVLVTNLGDIPLSKPLAEGEIEDFVDSLGDLVFKSDLSKEGHAYFILQKPGGGIKQTRAADKKLNKMVAA